MLVLGGGDVSYERGTPELTGYSQVDMLGARSKFVNFDLRILVYLVACDSG